MPAKVPDVVAIPGGTFRMGDDTGRPDEGPVREVRVSPFAIARTPVTRAQYAEFLADTGDAPPPWWSDPVFAGDDRPVVGVSWHDADAYTAWLSARTGQPWRLPSEAEWERAMRGGLPCAPTAWGAEVPVGEVPVGPLAAPWPVGRGRANGFGVLDPGTMVHEWCADWYAPSYDPAATDDPRGPEEGERRASRGGSWRHRVRWSPPSARSSLPPESRYADYGFRPVRALIRG